MRRAVSQTRGGSWTGREYRQYLCGVKVLVYRWISKRKGALLMMISTYIWSLGQTNPMAKIKEPLLNVSHPRTLNEQACPPIQIYATDIEDL